ncbi:MAG: hypothetical protein WC785_10120 [Tatlockia sp.]|jgi:hypothetical protein
MKAKLELSLCSDERINNLCDAIKQRFNQSTSRDPFRLFPFANESDFYITINKLAAITPYPTDKIRIALLTGESNILSILPEIRLHADLVLLNDVNTSMHLHTQFLLDCLSKSSSKGEFKQHYMEKKGAYYCNPLVGKVTDNVNLTINKLWSNLTFTDTGNKHILRSGERFDSARQALNQLAFSWASINFFDATGSQILQDILNSHNAVITLFNLTNLHHYAPRRNVAKTMLTPLVKNNLHSILLYSIGHYNFNSPLRLVSKVSTTSEFLQFLDQEVALLEKYLPPNIRAYEENYRSLVRFANGVLRAAALKENIPLYNLPKLIINSMEVSIDWQGLLNYPIDGIAITAQRKLLALFKKIMPWSHRQYLDDDAINASIHSRDSGLNQKVDLAALLYFVENQVSPALVATMITRANHFLLQIVRSEDSEFARTPVIVLKPCGKKAALQQVSYDEKKTLIAKYFGVLWDNHVLQLHELDAFIQNGERTFPTYRPGFFSRCNGARTVEAADSLMPYESAQLR